MGDTGSQQSRRELPEIRPSDDAHVKAVESAASSAYQFGLDGSNFALDVLRLVERIRLQDMAIQDMESSVKRAANGLY